MDYSSDLYIQAFRYAKGLSDNIQIFTGAMRAIMEEGIWKSGWIDKVSGEKKSTPTLQAFIEWPAPRGIGQTIPWIYSAFKSAKDFGEKEAAKAIILLNTQIKFETGETADQIYQRTIREAAGQVPAISKHGGDRRSKNFVRSRLALTLKRGPGARAYTIARLKRDGRTDLAKKVVQGKMSAKDAAREAEYGKQVRSKPTPFEIVLKLVPKLTTEERAKLKELL